MFITNHRPCIDPLRTTSSIAKQSAMRTVTTTNSHGMSLPNRRRQSSTWESRFFKIPAVPTLLQRRESDIMIAELSQVYQLGYRLLLLIKKYYDNSDIIIISPAHLSRQLEECRCIFTFLFHITGRTRCLKRTGNKTSSRIFLHI